MIDNILQDTFISPCRESKRINSNLNKIIYIFFCSNDYNIYKKLKYIQQIIVKLLHQETLKLNRLDQVLDNLFAY